MAHMVSYVGLLLWLNNVAFLRLDDVFQESRARAIGSGKEAKA